MAHEAPLELEGVIPHLLEAGLVSPESVFGDRVELSIQQRKNTSFIARIGDRSLLLKRPQIADDPGVDRELAFYSTFLPNRAELKAFVPELLGYDRRRSLIIIRYFPRHDDLRRRFARAGPTPPGIGARIAQALATLHDMPLTDQEGGEFRAPVPWALSLLAPPLDVLVTESRGGVEIIRRVQASATLVSLLGRLNEDFRSDGFCHGDIRLDNLLSGSQPRLVIVDWEMSGLGSTLWDLGCLMASFVELWVTAAIRPPDDPMGATTPAKWNLARFQPLLARFWTDYCKRRGADRDWAAWPKPVAELAGLRLVQSSLEYSQRSVLPTRESIMLLSLAERFAAKPLESWVHILGLPLAGVPGVALA